MSSRKTIGVSISKSYFIAYIESDGIHKIMTYPDNKNGINSFLDELDDNTVIGIERRGRFGAFIKSIKHLIKEYILLCHEDFISFISLTDKEINE